MLVHEESEDAFSSEAWVNVVKWNEHFTESAIFSLRQCCINKVGNLLVESSGFYIEVID
jgi:hypothetical protein